MIDIQCKQAGVMGGKAAKGLSLMTCHSQIPAVDKRWISCGGPCGGRAPADRLHVECQTTFRVSDDKC